MREWLLRFLSLPRNYTIAMFYFVPRLKSRHKVNSASNFVIVPVNFVCSGLIDRDDVDWNAEISSRLYTHRRSKGMNTKFIYSFDVCVVCWLGKFIYRL